MWKRIDKENAVIFLNMDNIKEISILYPTEEGEKQGYKPKVFIDNDEYSIDPQTIIELMHVVMREERNR